MITPELDSAAARFRREKEAIAETIERRGFNANIGSYTSELDGSTVDGSLLQMPCVGYQVSDARRIASTYELISRRLGRNGLIDRYEHGYDGSSSREGTFGICEECGKAISLERLRAIPYTRLCIPCKQVEEAA